MAGMARIPYALKHLAAPPSFRDVVLGSASIFYGYRIVAAAFAAQFVALGIFSYVLGPFMLPMIEEFGWTRGEYTLARSIGQVAMGLAGFFIGAHVDRLGARPLMMAGATVLMVALAAQAGVQTLWQWLLLNGVAVTLGCAMVGNLVVNVTMSKWFVEKRGQVIAWASMGVSLAGILLTPAVTLLIDTIGWRLAWLVLAGLAALLVYPAALVMRRAPEDFGWHPDGRTQAQVDAGLGHRAAADFARSMTRGQALRTPTFYLLVLAFGLFSINIVVMLLQTVPYLSDAGLSRPLAAGAIMVASIPALVSKPIWGFFVDRVSPKPLAALGAGVTGVALVVIIVAVEMHALTLIYLGYFLLGLGWGGMIPLQEVIWGSYFGRRHLGAVRSAGLPITLLFGALAPLLVSMYQDQTGSYTGALVAVAVCNLVGALLILAIPPPRREVIAAGAA
jgi:MFS transporter, OFA family, oxalate/formate antiporter